MLNEKRKGEREEEREVAWGISGIENERWGWAREKGRALKRYRCMGSERTTRREILRRERMRRETLKRKRRCGGETLK
jgi:hypothetical protein